MKIYKTKKGIVVHLKNDFFLSRESSWDSFVNRPDLFQAVSQDVKSLTSDPSLEEVVKTGVLAPIGNQEVWASGVTYMRSRQARMEESKDAGGGIFMQGFTKPPARNYFSRQLPVALWAQGSRLR